jgi:hypothetical protein
MPIGLPFLGPVLLQHRADGGVAVRRKITRDDPLDLGGCGIWMGLLHGATRSTSPKPTKPNRPDKGMAGATISMGRPDSRWTGRRGQS